MRGISGSGPLGVEAQTLWLGQPAQASPRPARVDSGPGQCSGSGAMREGWFFRGAEKSIWMGSSMLVVVAEGIFRGVWRCWAQQRIKCRVLSADAYQCKMVSRCMPKD